MAIPPACFIVPLGSILVVSKFLPPCFGVYLYPKSSFSRRYYEGSQCMTSNDWSSFFMHRIYQWASSIGNNDLGAQSDVQIFGIYRVEYLFFLCAAAKIFSQTNLMIKPCGKILPFMMTKMPSQLVYYCNVFRIQNLPLLWCCQNFSFWAHWIQSLFMHFQFFMRKPQISN